MPITKRSVLDAIETERARRETSWTASWREEVNLHKNSLLEEARNAALGYFDGTAPLDYLKNSNLLVASDTIRNPFTLFSKFNELMAKDIAWEEKRKTTSGWKFFDMLLTQQIKLLDDYFKNSKLEVSAIHLKQGQEQIAALNKMLGTRMAAFGGSGDKKFEWCKKCKEALDQVDAKIALEYKKLHSNDSFIGGMEKTTRKIDAGKAPTPVVSKSFSRETKGILYLIDLDLTSWDKHSNSIIDVMIAGCNHFLRPREEKEYFYKNQIFEITKQIKAEKKAGKTVKALEEKKKQLEADLRNEMAAQTNAKQYKDLLKKIITHPIFQQVDLWHDSATLLAELSMIPEFDKFFRLFQEQISDFVKSYKKEFDLEPKALIRPLLYAIQNRQEGYLNNDFYGYCLETINPLPVDVGSNEIGQQRRQDERPGLKTFAASLPATDHIGIVSLNEYLDAEFLKTRGFPEIFKFKADDVERMQFEILPSGIIPPSNRYQSHKVLHLIMSIIKMKKDTGHYPSQVIVVDDQASIIDGLQVGNINSVIDKLSREDILDRIRNFYATSKDPANQELAALITKKEVLAAAKIAVEVYPVEAKGEHFKELIEGKCVLNKGRNSQNKQDSESEGDGMPQIEEEQPPHFSR